LIAYYTDYANSGTDNAPTYVKVDGIGGVDEIRERIFSGLEA
jgi:adenylate kinase